MSARTYVNIAKGLGIFVAGAVLGAAGGIWWMTETFRVANEYAALTTAASAGEAAVEQYLFSRPEVAVYALERYITFLRRQRDSKLEVLDTKTIDMDLALALARLALSQEKLGKAKEASQLYEQSREAFAQAGRRIGSIEELKRIMTQLDQKVRENWDRKSAP
jgi:hypothetical protein